MMEVEVSAMFNREFELPFVPFVIVAFLVVCSLCGMAYFAIDRDHPEPPVVGHFPNGPPVIVRLR